MLQQQSPQRGSEVKPHLPHLKNLKFHQGLKRLKSKKHLQATSEAGEFIFTSSSSSRVVAASSLKPAEGEKPASPKVTQKNLPQKRLSSKKPAAQPAEAKSSWVASPSFGWVHETKTTKASIWCTKSPGKIRLVVW